MKQVLIVDDFLEVRMVLRALLEEPDVEVLEAGDGLEALEVLGQENVDLVLTDCKMPNMNGIELMREAKLRYPETPFIVISSTVEDEHLADLHPYAVMPKPFRLADLKQVVQRALDKN